jgi:hypothetical protein
LLAGLSVEILGRDPDLVALGHFEHLAGATAIGSDPRCRGVGHCVFDDARSDHTAVMANFHPGIDEQVPLNMFAGDGSV